MRELAERAVACKHWRWMAGMRLRAIRRYLRIVGCNSDGTFRLSWDDPDGPVEGGSVVSVALRRMTPDLTDPATLGCVMALVREAYANAVVITQGNGWWSVETDHYFWDQDNTTSFREALVKALEAAP